MAAFCCASGSSLLAVLCVWAGPKLPPVVPLKCTQLPHIRSKCSSAPRKTESMHPDNYLPFGLIFHPEKCNGKHTPLHLFACFFFALLLAFRAGMGARCVHSSQQPKRTMSTSECGCTSCRLPFCSTLKGKKKKRKAKMMGKIRRRRRRFRD